MLGERLEQSRADRRTRKDSRRSTDRRPARSRARTIRIPGQRMISRDANVVIPAINFHSRAAQLQLKSLTNFPRRGRDNRGKREAEAEGEREEVRTSDEWVVGLRFRPYGVHIPFLVCRGTLPLSLCLPARGHACDSASVSGARAGSSFPEVDVPLRPRTPATRGDHPVSARVEYNSHLVPGSSIKAFHAFAASPRSLSSECTEKASPEIGWRASEGNDTNRNRRGGRGKRISDRLSLAGAWVPFERVVRLITVVNHGSRSRVLFFSCEAIPIPVSSDFIAPRI